MRGQRLEESCVLRKLGEGFQKHARANIGGRLARFGNWVEAFQNMRGLLPGEACALKNVQIFDYF